MFPFPPKTSEFLLQPLVRGAMGPSLPPRAPLWNPAPGLQAANAGGSTSIKRIRYFDAPRQDLAPESAPIGGQLEDIEEELVYLERPTVEVHLNHILEKYTKLKNHQQQLQLENRRLRADNERLFKEKLHFENRAVTERMARHSAEVNARKEVLELRNEITNLKADKHEFFEKIEELTKNAGIEQNNYSSGDMADMEFMKPSQRNDDEILNENLTPRLSFNQQLFSLDNVQDQNQPQPTTSMTCAQFIENIAPVQKKIEKTTTQPFLEVKPDIGNLEYKATYQYNENLAFIGLMAPLSQHEDKTTFNEKQHPNSPQDEQSTSEDNLLDQEVASFFIGHEQNQELQVTESGDSD